MKLNETEKAKLRKGNFLAVSEACKNIFRFQGVKDKTLDISVFPLQMALRSVSYNIT